MNLGELLPAPLLWWASVAALGAALALAILSAPWRALLARRERQHALGLAIILLPMLWSMSPGLPAGVKLQLIGMTAVSALGVETQASPRIMPMSMKDSRENS